MAQSGHSFKHFKSEMVYERYLDILPYKIRTVISQLRLAAHQLRIVTGRYAQNRIDRSLRLCTLCNNSHIEDESSRRCSRISSVPFYYNLFSL